MRCSAECLGGCLTKDDNNRQLKLSKTQNECYSCKNFLSPMSSEKFSTHGNHGCWPKCSEGFVSVRSLVGLRRCKILDNRWDILEPKTWRKFSSLFSTKIGDASQIRNVRKNNTKQIRTQRLEKKKVTKSLMENVLKNAQVILKKRKKMERKLAR